MELEKYQKGKSWVWKVHIIKYNYHLPEIEMVKEVQYINNIPSDVLRNELVTAHKMFSFFMNNLWIASK